MDIATRLRELLEQRGLTQSRVAELAGLPNETLNRIVTGTTKNPGVITIMKVARALGVTLGWLADEKGFEFSPERRAELRRFITWGEELLDATQPEDPELQPPNASAVTLGRRPPPARAAPRTGDAGVGDRLARVVRRPA